MSHATNFKFQRNSTLVYNNIKFKSLRLTVLRLTQLYGIGSCENGWKKNHQVTIEMDGEYMQVCDSGNASLLLLVGFFASNWLGQCFGLSIRDQRFNENETNKTETNGKEDKLNDWKKKQFTW